MTVKKPDIAILLLAAGQSARLGQPKQLVRFKNKSLLGYVTDEAIASGCGPVFVVLGSKSDLLREELLEKEVRIIENIRWKDGMASSIRCGIEMIDQSGLHPEFVLILLCDQPYICAALLEELVKTQRATRMPVVASDYGTAVGTPAIFHKSYFPQLMALKGDKGAQSLITADPAKLATASFPRGVTDIDTAEDYELLNKHD